MLISCIIQLKALKAGTDLPEPNRYVLEADMATKQHAKWLQVERPKTQYHAFPLPIYEKSVEEENQDDAYLDGEITAVAGIGKPLGTEESGNLDKFQLLVI